MARQRKKRSGRRAGSWRTCAGCGRRLPRRRSLRLVRAVGGYCQADVESSAQGRGLHLCASLACLEKARQRGAAGRWFRQATVLDEERLGSECHTQLGILLQKIIEQCERQGWLARGREAVQRALNRNRVALLLSAAGGRAESEMAGLSAGIRCDSVPMVLIGDEAWPQQWTAEERPRVAAIMHRGVAARIYDLSLKMTGLQEGRRTRCTSPRGTALTESGRAEMMPNGHLSRESGAR